MKSSNFSYSFVTLLFSIRETNQIDLMNLQPTDSVVVIGSYYDSKINSIKDLKDFLSKGKSTINTLSGIKIKFMHDRWKNQLPTFADSNIKIQSNGESKFVNPRQHLSILQNIPDQIDIDFEKEQIKINEDLKITIQGNANEYGTMTLIIRRAIVSNLPEHRTIKV